MNEQSSHQLAEFRKTLAALNKSTDLNEIQQIRGRAEAARHLAKSAALGVEVQNLACEVKLRAERKVGKALIDLHLRGGDRRKDRLTLADLGITQNQSTRWQRIAKISDRAFEEYIQRSHALAREMTATGLFQDPKSNRARVRNKKLRQKPGHRQREIADRIAILRHHLGVLRAKLDVVAKTSPAITPYEQDILQLMGDISALVEDLDQQDYEASDDGLEPSE